MNHIGNGAAHRFDTSFGAFKRSSIDVLANATLMAVRTTVADPTNHTNSDGTDKIRDKRQYLVDHISKWCRNSVQIQLAKRPRDGDDKDKPKNNFRDNTLRS